MSKGVELTEKELKEVSGGAYIKDGYVYYQADGINKRAKILSNEDYIKTLCSTCKDDDAVAYALYVAHVSRGWVDLAEDC